MKISQNLALTLQTFGIDLTGIKNEDGDGEFIVPQDLCNAMISGHLCYKLLLLCAQKFENERLMQEIQSIRLYPQGPNISNLNYSLLYSPLEQIEIFIPLNQRSLISSSDENAISSLFTKLGMKLEQIMNENQLDQSGESRKKRNVYLRRKLERERMSSSTSNEIISQLPDNPIQNQFHQINEQETTKEEEIGLMARQMMEVEELKRRKIAQEEIMRKQKENEIIRLKAEKFEQQNVNFQSQLSNTDFQQVDRQGSKDDQQGKHTQLEEKEKQHQLEESGSVILHQSVFIFLKNVVQSSYFREMQDLVISRESGERFAAEMGLELNKCIGGDCNVALGSSIEDAHYISDIPKAVLQTSPRDFLDTKLFTKICSKTEMNADLKDNKQSRETQNNKVLIVSTASFLDIAIQSINQLQNDDGSNISGKNTINLSDLICHSTTCFDLLFALAEAAYGLNNEIISNLFTMYFYGTITLQDLFSEAIPSRVELERKNKQQQQQQQLLIQDQKKPERLNNPKSKKKQIIKPSLQNKLVQMKTLPKNQQRKQNISYPLNQFGDNNNLNGKINDKNAFHSFIEINTNNEQIGRQLIAQRQNNQYKQLKNQEQLNRFQELQNDINKSKIDALNRSNSSNNQSVNDSIQQSISSQILTPVSNSMISFTFPSYCAFVPEFIYSNQDMNQESSISFIHPLFNRPSLAFFLLAQKEAMRMVTLAIETPQMISFILDLIAFGMDCSQFKSQVHDNRTENHFDEDYAERVLIAASSCNAVARLFECIFNELPQYITKEEERSHDFFMLSQLHEIKNDGELIIDGKRRINIGVQQNTLTEKIQIQEELNTEIQQNEKQDINNILINNRNRGNISQDDSAIKHDGKTGRLQSKFNNVLSLSSVRALKHNLHIIQRTAWNWLIGQSPSQQQQKKSQKSSVDQVGKSGLKKALMMLLNSNSYYMIAPTSTPLQSYQSEQYWKQYSQMNASEQQRIKQQYCLIDANDTSAIPRAFARLLLSVSSPPDQQQQFPNIQNSEEKNKIKVLKEKPLIEQLLIDIIPMLFVGDVGKYLQFTERMSQEFVYLTNDTLLEKYEVEFKARIAAAVMQQKRVQQLAHTREKRKKERAEWMRRVKKEIEQKEYREKMEVDQISKEQEYIKQQEKITEERKVQEEAQMPGLIKMIKQNNLEQELEEQKKLDIEEEQQETIISQWVFATIRYENDLRSFLADRLAYMRRKRSEIKDVLRQIVDAGLEFCTTILQVQNITNEQNADENGEKKTKQKKLKNKKKKNRRSIQLPQLVNQFPNQDQLRFPLTLFSLNYPQYSVQVLSSISFCIRILQLFPSIFNYQDLPKDNDGEKIIQNYDRMDNFIVSRRVDDLTSIIQCVCLTPFVDFWAFLLLRCLSLLLTSMLYQTLHKKTSFLELENIASDLAKNQIQRNLANLSSKQKFNNRLQNIKSNEQLDFYSNNNIIPNIKKEKEQTKIFEEQKAQFLIQMRFDEEQRQLKSWPNRLILLARRYVALFFSHFPLLRTSVLIRLSLPFISFTDLVSLPPSLSDNSTVSSYLTPISSAMSQISYQQAQSVPSSNIDKKAQNINNIKQIGIKRDILLDFSRKPHYLPLSFAQVAVQFGQILQAIPSQCINDNIQDNQIVQLNNLQSNSSLLDMVIEVLRSRLGCRRCEEGDIELLLSLLHFPKISTQYLVRIIRIIVPLLLCGKRQINFNWDIVNSEIQDDFEQGEYEDSNSENDKVNEDGKENILTKSQNGKDNINFNNELKQKGYKNEEQLDQLRLQSEDNVQTENTEKDHVRRALSILSSSDEAWRLAELQAKYNHMPAKYWVNDTFSALRNHLENDVLQIPPGLNKSILFRKLAEIVRKALQRIAEGGDTEKERAINLYQKKNIKENESQVKLDKQSEKSNKLYETQIRQESQRKEREQILFILIESIVKHAFSELLKNKHFVKSLKHHNRQTQMEESFINEIENVFGINISKNQLIQNQSRIQQQNQQIEKSNKGKNMKTLEDNDLSSNSSDGKDNQSSDDNTNLDFNEYQDILNLQQRQSQKIIQTNQIQANNNNLIDDEDEEEEENVQVQTELIPLRTQSPNTADVTKILAATAASRQRAEAAAKKRAAQNLDDPYFPIRESNTQNSYERRSFDENSQDTQNNIDNQNDDITHKKKKNKHFCNTNRERDQQIKNRHHKHHHRNISSRRKTHKMKIYPTTLSSTTTSIMSMNSSCISDSWIPTIGQKVLVDLLLSLMCLQNENSDINLYNVTEKENQQRSEKDIGQEDVKEVDQLDNILCFINNANQEHNDEYKTIRIKQTLEYVFSSLFNNVHARAGIQIEKEINTLSEKQSQISQSRNQEQTSIQPSIISKFVLQTLIQLLNGVIVEKQNQQQQYSSSENYNYQCAQNQQQMKNIQDQMFNNQEDNIKGENQQNTNNEFQAQDGVGDGEWVQEEQIEEYSEEEEVIDDNYVDQQNDSEFMIQDNNKQDQINMDNIERIDQDDKMIYQQQEEQLENNDEVLDDGEDQEIEFGGRSEFGDEQGDEQGGIEYNNELYNNELQNNNLNDNGNGKIEQDDLNNENEEEVGENIQLNNKKLIDNNNDNSTIDSFFDGDSYFINPDAQNILKNKKKEKNNDQQIINKQIENNAEQSTVDSVIDGNSYFNYPDAQNLRQNQELLQQNRNQQVKNNEMQNDNKTQQSSIESFLDGNSYFNNSNAKVNKQIKQQNGENSINFNYQINNNRSQLSVVQESETPQPLYQEKIKQKEEQKRIKEKKNQEKKEEDQRKQQAKKEEQKRIKEKKNQEKKEEDQRKQQAKKEEYEKRQKQQREKDEQKERIEKEKNEKKQQEKIQNKQKNDQNYQNENVGDEQREREGRNNIMNNKFNDDQQTNNIQIQLQNSQQSPKMKKIRIKKTRIITNNVWKPKPKSSYNANLLQLQNNKYQPQENSPLIQDKVKKSQHQSSNLIPLFSSIKEQLPVLPQECLDFQNEQYMEYENNNERKGLSQFDLQGVELLIIYLAGRTAHFFGLGAQARKEQIKNQQEKLKQLRIIQNKYNENIHDKLKDNNSLVDQQSNSSYSENDSSQSQYSSDENSDTDSSNPIRLDAKFDPSLFPFSYWLNKIQGITLQTLFLQDLLIFHFDFDWRSIIKSDNIVGDFSSSFEDSPAEQVLLSIYAKNRLFFYTPGTENVIALSQSDNQNQPVQNQTKQYEQTNDKFNIQIRQHSSHSVVQQKNDELLLTPQEDERNRQLEVVQQKNKTQINENKLENKNGVQPNLIKQVQSMIDVTKKPLKPLKGLTHEQKQNQQPNLVQAIHLPLLLGGINDQSLQNDTQYVQLYNQYLQIKGQNKQPLYTPKPKIKQNITFQGGINNNNQFISSRLGMEDKDQMNKRIAIRQEMLEKQRARKQQQKIQEQEQVERAKQLRIIKRRLLEIQRQKKHEQDQKWMKNIDQNVRQRHQEEEDRIWKVQQAKILEDFAKRQEIARLQPTNQGQRTNEGNQNPLLHHFT